MAAVAQNTTIVAGDTAELSFSVFEEDGTTPLDLTGATIRWQMRRSRSDTGAALVEKTTSDGITVTDAEGGLFNVTLDPADTEDIAIGRYPHGAVVTDADSNVSTISMGFVVVRAAAVVVAEV